MRTDTSYSFYLLSKVEDACQEFPLADTITRRLKKLIATIMKSVESGEVSFENEANMNEPTGLSLPAKNCLITMLHDFGIPLSAELKNDWPKLREMVARELPDDETVAEKNIGNVERFVQRVRMVAQQLM